MQNIESNITAVTVFMDRALIVRTATLSLPTGEHTLTFDNLPESVDSKSVQVSGIGNATLMGVKFQKHFFANNTNEETRTLETKLRQLNDEIHALALEKKRWDSEKKFLEAILLKVTTTTEKSDNAELNPDSWIRMMDFHSQKIIEINQNTLKIDYQTRELEQKQQALKRQINEVNLPNSLAQVRRSVEVVVHVKQEGALVLSLSYIVQQASWYPVYDVRVSTETKKVNLTYNAMVKQNTGEAWENVRMKISTAQPQISGQHEELTPWLVDIYHAAPGGKIMLGGAISPRNQEIAQQKEAIFDIMLNENNEESFGSLKNDQMKTQNAVAETGANAVFFNIAGNHTVKTDNTEHKVTILVEDFEAHFRYSTIPKKTPLAYLKAKIRNNSTYPLLAGESNIFLDNNFVSNAHIETVPPNEEFWAFLGVDEAMKVDYKLLRKYEKQEGGLITKKITQITFEYQIKIKNTKQTEEEIVIWEQLPISQNAQIKVHLIEPTYKEDTPQLKKNEFEALKWFFKMKPQEEITLLFKFSIEYPYNQQISGL
jgi:uncharacterized protein (TIGR02231 family)